MINVITFHIKLHVNMVKIQTLCKVFIYFVYFFKFIYNLKTATRNYKMLGSAAAANFDNVKLEEMFVASYVVFI